MSQHPTRPGRLPQQLPNIQNAPGFFSIAFAPYPKTLRFSTLPTQSCETGTVSAAALRWRRAFWRRRSCDGLGRFRLTSLAHALLRTASARLLAWARRRHDDAADRRRLLARPGSWFWPASGWRRSACPVDGVTLRTTVALRSVGARGKTFRHPRWRNCETNPSVPPRPMREPRLVTGATDDAFKTVWPSGLRRWLQAPVRKGVGSNPTAVIVFVAGASAWDR